MKKRIKFSKDELLRIAEKETEEVEKRLFDLRGWLRNNHPEVIREYDDARLFRAIFGEVNIPNLTT